jgi:putative DNA primase/helicase
MTGQRPQVYAPGDLAHATDQALAAVLEWLDPTDAERFIARFGTALVRLEQDSGQLVTVRLDRAKMTHLLSRVIDWRLWREDKESKPIPPPREVADDLLAYPQPPFPALERIVEVPVMAADGTVHDQPGYDPATRCFLRPAGGLSVPPIATHPTAEHVRRAAGLFTELVRDFPFRGLDDNGKDVGAHERPHAYSALLQPFVRALIDGPTPLHLFEAPAPGTGKTLLVLAVATPALGARPLPAMAEAHGGDEWRKRITAKLRRAPEYVLIDNIRRPLDSSALALALTAATYEDRLLGVSETIRLPVRCAWLATANNPLLSDEMTRRTVRIRLDAQVEFPEERDGFTHPHLLAWARSRRGEFVWAALTLARSWIVAGMPDPTVGRHFGGFEDWVHVVGGILEHADLGGILGNVNEVRASNRDASTGAFLEAAWLKFANAEWTANAAIVLGQQYLDIGAGSEAQLAHLLGNRLRAMQDRPYGGYVLRRPGRTQGNSARWTVDKLAAESP